MEEVWTGLWGEAVVVDRQSNAAEATDRREGMAIEHEKSLMILQNIWEEGTCLSYTFLIHSRSLLQIDSSVTCTSMPVMPILLSNPEHGAWGMGQRDGEYAGHILMSTNGMIFRQEHRY